MAPPRKKAAAGKRKIISSESESTPADSSSSEESGPSRSRNTKAVRRQVLNDSDDGSSTLSTLSIANSTKPKNSARKSTATRPRSQSSGSDHAKNANNIGARRARLGQGTATTSRKQIESDSEEDSEEESQKSKQVNSSKKNNSNKATANRTARQLNFATSSQNMTPTPLKRGRPPLKAKLTTATRDSSSSGTKKGLAATIASDESSDEEVVRPTPNARNNTAPRNFSPISKKLGPYSPFKKPSSDVLTSETKKQLVNSCIHYLLIVDQKKYAIKKTDLKKNIFKDNCSAKVFNEVILEVNKTLKQVFGLELMELENKKDQYMIHNNLHNALELAEFSEKMQAERGLLTYLLTLIFMNGNSILEEDLWTSLKTFKLFRDPKKPHPCFGEVSRLLDKLERQMYLERSKIPNTEPTLSEYKWGLRAKLEVRKTDLLEFACAAYGDCNPEDWILQFKETNLENEDSDED